ncbi:variant erythrocyte surface antigen-1 family protein [Babesia divergens]|uniref:Variant erythrocyte surface antigen-1 family protein n=1 Tax=Babesia divergens TaxID=32595 RepID=A0AAD9GEK1_BABDI|nr:variant erythrocyte surface antigen-1 family protein [Babesia divergens]
MCIIIIVILESQSALGLYFIVLFLVYSFHCLSLHCKVRMFFIPSCFPGCRIIVSLSVLRTLRSVLTGSLGQLGRMTLKVCYMYYTDVFVGQDNIENLKNALDAELKGSELNDDLNALASGLGNFIGYSGGQVNGSGIGKTGSQNSSSYSDKATWEELCEKCQCKSVSKSNSSCKSCSCGSSGSSVCDPKDCCENCDVRKAAKIFLGFIPCLYYALKYLYKQCKVDWKNFEISNKDHSLGRFLVGMGFDLAKLQGKKGSEIFPLLKTLFNGSSNGPLQSLYEKSKKYFTSSSHSHVPSSTPKPKEPLTVRDILLWLSGLPFSKGFKALLDHCKDLCLATGTSKNSVNPENFETSLFNSCFLSPFVLAAIEGSKSDESEGFPPYYSEWKDFSYPEDPSDLLEMLCEYTRKVFPPLKFLCMQCELDKDQGGWKNCAFGRQCAQKFQEISSLAAPSASVPSSSGSCSCPNSKTYLCTAINKDKVHDHCQKGSCLGFGSGPCSSHTSKPGSAPVKCTPCPHHLMRFLIDDSSDSDSKSKALQNFRTPFHSSTVTPMGFSSEKLPKKARWGKDLYHDIYGFCKDGFYPLTRLVQFILCVSRHPPETLGELFAFFVKFGKALNSKPDLSSTFVQWINGEPGFYSGLMLQSALENLYGSHSGDHSPANLFSLSGCHANKASGATCGPYLHPLTEEAYNIFIDKFADTYLSWVCYSAEKFYSEFQKFHKEAEKKFSSSCSHCTSCTKIVECPCALPFLYSQGFTLNSPSGLNCVDAQGTKHGGGGGHAENETGKCTTKSCQDFITQLRLVAEGQPFKDLLKVIDNFLWSIRLPFVYTFLYIWILVISYFYYVQFYKLDLLHIDSHLHLPRSFKILPSTLFSDASSKLKDLSYFTL